MNPQENLQKCNANHPAINCVGLGLGILVVLAMAGDWSGGGTGDRTEDGAGEGTGDEAENGTED